LRADAASQRVALEARVRAAAKAEADSKPPATPSLVSPAAPAKPGPAGSLADLMQYLQLRHQIQHAGHFAGSYWGGAAWRECTEAQR